MGKEVLLKSGGDELHFVLAASCFLAAAGQEGDELSEAEDVAPARVEAALRASLKAHKRIAGGFSLLSDLRCVQT
jgi:hypothetical protein